MSTCTEKTETAPAAGAVLLVMNCFPILGAPPHRAHQEDGGACTIDTLDLSLKWVVHRAASLRAALIASRSTGSATARPVWVETTIAFASSSDSSASRRWHARLAALSNRALRNPSWTSRCSPRPAGELDPARVTFPGRQTSRPPPSDAPEIGGSKRSYSERLADDSIRPRSPTSSMRWTPGSASRRRAFRPRRPRTRGALSPCPRSPSAARAAARIARHRHRQPCEVAEKVERVRRLVHQHTSALALPGPAPARRCRSRRSAGRTDRRSTRERVTPGGLRRQPPGGRDHGPEALLEADAEQTSRSSAAAIIASASRASGASGFSHQDVRAGLERRDRQLGMRRMRRADHDDVRVPRRVARPSLRTPGRTPAPALRPHPR